MSRRPLYVRLPTSEAQKLDRAAFELGTSKQDLVTGLVSRYVDPTPRGLSALRGLSASPGVTVGRHEFIPNEDPPVLTLEQVAELLQVEPDAARELAEQGELPGRRVGDDWRFSRDAVLRWLEG